jgi:hypothetical protein
MSVIDWILDGEPIYAKTNVNFPRLDGSVNDIMNRPLLNVLTFSEVNDSEDFPGFACRYHGTGSPEGVVTSPPGRLYFQTDGASGSMLWIKESGTGNTGWALAGGTVITSDTIKGATPILEIFDTLVGWNNNQASMILRFGSIIGPSSISTMFNTSVGSGSSTVLLANGVLTRRIAPNGVSATAGISSDQLGVPIGLKVGTSPAPSRTFRKFTLECSAYASALATAGHGMGYGISSTGDVLSNGATNPRGFMFEAAQGLNSGNWVVRYRQTNGGGLTTVNTAISATAVAKLKIVYTEGTTPTIEAFINGISQASLSGDANMFDVVSNPFYKIIVEGVTGGAGGTFNFDSFDHHYLIEEV